MSEDLLNTLNSRKEESNSASSAEPKLNENPHEVLTPENSGEASSTEKKAETQVEAKEEKKEATPKEDENVDSLFKEPETWTKESAMVEAKKLREEAKQRRLQLKEMEDKYEKERETIRQQYEDELKTASEAKKELEAIKAKEEDKKRTMEDKLAHREAKIQELEGKFDSVQSEYQKEMEDLKKKLSAYEAEREAQQKVYKERISEELNQVPEKFRKYAETMVRGFDDPSEAWEALSEAKMNGLFEEKSVVVNHATPGAENGARTTSEAANAAERERKEKLTSTQRIKEGLNKVSRNKRSLI